MTETWTRLAQQHGAKAAVSLSISDEELNALTKRQSDYLIDVLRPHLRGDEQRVLDYGCGSGRLVGMLHELILHPQPIVHGFDPCSEMLHLHQAVPEKPVTLFSKPPLHLAPYDLVFMAMVLGDPECKVGMCVYEATSHLSKNGLFVLLEHTKQWPKPGTWWRFRSVGFYTGLFNGYDVKLEVAGMMPQVDNEVTIFVGRRKGAAP